MTQMAIIASKAVSGHPLHRNREMCLIARNNEISLSDVRFDGHLRV